MNGEHLCLLGPVNMCLLASGRLVANNAHRRNRPGGHTHAGNEQPCIIHSDADCQFFQVGAILQRC